MGVGDDYTPALCRVCLMPGGNVVKCDGGCHREFHPECLGVKTPEQFRMMNQWIFESGRYDCNDCRVGKATCDECGRVGFLDERTEGLVRCAVPGCGRAYHRNCLPFNAMESGVLTCPAHACRMCSEDDPAVCPMHASSPQRRMLTCVRCPTAFCDRQSCQPRDSKIIRFGGPLILCGHSRADHRQGKEAATALGDAGGDATSVVDDARLGDSFEHLIVPEAGDERSGCFYEAGVGMGAGRYRAREFYERESLAVRSLDEPLLPGRKLASFGEQDAADAKQAKALIEAGAIPWDAASVPSHLRQVHVPSAPGKRLGSLVLRAQGERSAHGKRWHSTAQAAFKEDRIIAAGGLDLAIDASNPDSLRAYTVEVSAEAVEHSYVGRFFPVSLTRTSKFVEADTGRPRRYLRGVVKPTLTPKLRNAVLTSATGDGSLARAIITRGTAIHAKLVDYDGSDVRLNSYSNGFSSRVGQHEFEQLIEAVAANGDQPLPHQLQAKWNRLRSAQRTLLNGMAMYRAKYTSFSRHYTNASVLRHIANHLQSMLLPGDTFVDFACGQNSFGALLKDPLSQQPLSTVAYDIFSPAENTSDFTRRPWQSVDATSLPPGELVIGLNPPFGHNNREAIEFVQHSLCAQPRLLVLIMPATNFVPPGYTLEHMDDQICRNWAFYSPGTNTSWRIKAANVDPNFYIYRRNDPRPPVRVARCCHLMDSLSRMKRSRGEANLKMQRARVHDEQLEQMLCEPCHF